jgi:hypothetical protein
MPAIHKGCTIRIARICEREIPLNVYQRKKALMRRPGTVFQRWRAPEALHPGDSEDLEDPADPEAPKAALMRRDSPGEAPMKGQRSWT